MFNRHTILSPGHTQKLSVKRSALFILFSCEAVSGKAGRPSWVCVFPLGGEGGGTSPPPFISIVATQKHHVDFL